jgi:hypothetical protein
LALPGKSLKGHEEGFPPSNLSDGFGLKRRPSLEGTAMGEMHPIPGLPSLATGNLQAREGIGLAFQRVP